MKDRRTHLAHKAEHAVDLNSGALVAATLQATDQGDPATVEQTLSEARGNVEFLSASGLQDVVADKGLPQQRSAGGDERIGRANLPPGTGAGPAQLEWT